MYSIFIKGDVGVVGGGLMLDVLPTWRVAQIQEAIWQKQRIGGLTGGGVFTLSLTPNGTPLEAESVLQGIGVGPETILYARQRELVGFGRMHIGRMH